MFTGVYHITRVVENASARENEENTAEYLPSPRREYNLASNLQPACGRRSMDFRC